MSAEEASAKADALIAQYRATAPRRPKAKEVRVSDLAAAKGWFGERTLAVLVLAIGFAAGWLWRAAHPAWSALGLGVGGWIAFSLARRARSGPRSFDDEPAR